MSTYVFDMKIANRNKDRNTEHISGITGYTAITADSIQRVPCVQITAEANVNKLIRILHQDILTKAMQRNDGQRFDEVGYLLELVCPYNNTNAIYGVYDNNKQISSIHTQGNSEYEEFIQSHEDNQLIFMHNHPNNSDLSFGDIWNLVITDQLYAVTAVGNNGSVYSAYKDNTSFNKIDIKIKFKKFYKKIMKMGELDKNKMKIQLLDKLKSEQQKYGIKFRYSKRR